MKYADGTDIEPGDVVQIDRIYRGRVIASMDNPSTFLAKNNGPTSAKALSSILILVASFITHRKQRMISCLLTGLHHTSGASAKCLGRRHLTIHSSRTQIATRFESA
jgi:hypothetical protein